MSVLNLAIVAMAMISVAVLTNSQRMMQAGKILLALSAALIALGVAWRDGSVSIEFMAVYAGVSLATTAFLFGAKAEQSGNIQWARRMYRVAVAIASVSAAALAIVAKISL